LGLIRDGQLLRAAVLLFGKAPQRFHSSALVKIGRFRSPTLIVDDREVFGTLFDQVEGAMGYFREHLQTRFEFHGGPAREVIWEYPLEALREAITNAVCHRDYMDTTHIQVRWYDDRIVFFNSGELLAPLHLEDLKQVHPSVPRNHKIAEMFFYAGWIERWGSGIQKMLDECASSGLPEPEFEERTGGLWLTFRKDMWTEEHLRSLGLNERQIKAMGYVREKGRITNADVRRLASTSRESAKRDLADLVGRSLIVRKGSGRNAHYVLGQIRRREQRGNRGNKGPERPTRKVKSQMSKS
jgi:ATP-dependent DNA helicase RecG